ncbi:MAG TPA: Gfo/Idh/MocA family oxidoreductase, partial [Pirellulaceae bacterium]|nr:Gfo/Idh/MocA family oxidoreductase [Pirellulaceae bacterium]
MHYSPTILLCLTMLTTASGISLAQESAHTSPVRIGMIGLDTSHAIAFPKIFNNPQAVGDLADFQVVAGYPGGTDIPDSRDRVEGFTQQLREMGLEIVDSIPALIDNVDVILLESVDGRIHWQEAIPVIEAGKPLFIDKPMAGSLADAIAIFDMARQHNVPCFSSSSLRYSAGIEELRNNEQLGEIRGAATWFPCTYQTGTPDMFFYGIHGIEALYALMGPGCETVSRVQAEDADIITGVWQDGRVGTFRGIRRNKANFGAVAFGSTGIAHTDKGESYEPLCREIGKFFKTGQAPVSAEETIE